MLANHKDTGFGLPSSFPLLPLVMHNIFQILIISVCDTTPRRSPKFALI